MLHTGFNIKPRLSQASQAWRFALLFVVLSFIISGIGWLTYQKLRENILQDAQQNIAAIGILKRQQVENWLQERFADSRVLTDNSYLSQELGNWIKNGKGGNGPEHAWQYLERVVNAYNYHSIAVYDLADKKVFSVGKQENDTHSADARRAINAGHPVLIDFHQETSDTQLLLGVMAPLLSGGKTVGALHFLMDPADNLFPYIQKWPAPSNSAETLLVRRVGDNIIFLNELRHQQGLALPMHSSLSDRLLLTAQDLHAHSGLISGHDYRNKAVIGYATGISKTPWILIAKVDKEEITAPIQQAALFSTLLSVLFILVTGYLIWHKWRRLQSEQTLLEKRLEFLSNRADDGILLADTNNIILDINNRALAMYGYNRDELIGQKTTQLLASPGAKHSTPLLAKMQGTGEALFESQHRRKNGSIFPVEINARLIETASKPAIHVIIRNISERKKTEKAIRENEERLRISQLYGGIGTWEADLINNKQIWSEAITRVLGFPPLSHPDYDDFIATIHPEDRQLVIDAYNKHINHGAKYDIEYRIIDVHGKERWMRSIGQVERDHQGHPVRMRGTVQDITPLKLAETQLRLTAQVFENTLEGIMITTPDATIIEVNNAFTQITGFSREEVLGKNPRILQSGQQNEEFYKSMWQSLANNSYWHGEIWNRKKTGEIYAELLNISAITDKQGCLSHYVGIFSDITQLKHHEKQLERIAHYDPLTGIPNRVLLADRLNQALMHHQRSGKTLAVCYMDLDAFKPVNDQLGHQAGDILLKQVTQRLTHTLRSEDTVARIGGDEFVLLLGGFNDPDECALLLQRIIKAVALPYRIKETEVSISASIGVAFFPGDSTEAGQLLRLADQAMYSAKTSGKNKFYFLKAVKKKLAN